VLPEGTAIQVCLVSLAILASLEGPALFALHQHLHHATHVHLAHQDPLDLKDHPVILDLMVSLETQVKTELQVSPVLRDLPETPARPDLMDLLVNLVNPPQAPLPLPETLDPKEIPAPMDHPDHQAHLARTDNLEDLVPRVHLAHPAPLVKTDNPAKTVHLVPLALKANVVSAPNTVLWMEEFSSKMVPDDRNIHSSFLVPLAIWVEMLIASKGSSLWT
jgi:hypothetical protein